MIQIKGLNSDRSIPGTVDDPVDHLMACHRRIEARLDTLVRAGELWDQQPQEAAQAIQRAFAFMESTARLHTEDEEVSLFPRLASRVQPEEAELIRNLMQEHSEADEALQRLRTLASSLAAGGAVLDEYRALASVLQQMYQDHIRREDEQLTTATRRVLTTEELAAVGAEMRARRQNQSQR